MQRIFPQNVQSQLDSHPEEIDKKPVKERQKMFVHKDIDELGLDPYEFRVYGHIVRRGHCFASLEKMAATCCMSVRRVQYALKVLEQAELIQKEERKGRANKFVPTKPSQWFNKISREKLCRIRQKVKGNSKNEPGISELDEDMFETENLNDLISF